MSMMIGVDQVQREHENAKDDATSSSSSSADEHGQKSSCNDIEKGKLKVHMTPYLADILKEHELCKHEKGDKFYCTLCD